jgi:hypothetical protein
MHSYQRGTYPINRGAIPSKEGIIPLMVDLINFLLSTINTGIGPEGEKVESYTFLRVNAAGIRTPI